MRSDTIQTMAQSPHIGWCSTCYQYKVGLEVQAVGFVDLTSKMMAEEGRRRLSPILWAACQEHLAKALSAGFACYDLEGTAIRDLSGLSQE